MLDREVQVAQIAVPGCGRAVQHRAARLTPLELSEEELAEQVVVAVGERPPADLLDEQVAPDEAFEARAGVGHPATTSATPGVTTSTIAVRVRNRRSSSPRLWVSSDAR